MKKNIVLLVVIVSIFTFESAFAADRTTAPEASGKFFNGITYFDLGPASTCGDAEGTFEKESAVKMFNGTTAFDLGKPVSGAKECCAGQRAKETTMSKSYNGITVF